MSFANQQNPNDPFSVPQHDHPPAAQPQSSPPVASPAAGQPDPYAGFDTAEVMGQRQRKIHEFPGVFLLEVVEIREGWCEGRNKGKPFFAGSFIVVESSNNTLTEGGKVDWSTIQDTRYPEYFLSNIKGLLGAVLNTNPEQITLDIKNKAVHETQPARGRQVRCEVYMSPKTNKPRTRFYPA